MDELPDVIIPNPLRSLRTRIQTHSNQDPLGEAAFLFRPQVPSLRQDWDNLVDARAGEDEQCPALHQRLRQCREVAPSLLFQQPCAQLGPQTFCHVVLFCELAFHVLRLLLECVNHHRQLFLREALT